MVKDILPPPATLGRPSLETQDGTEDRQAMLPGGNFVSVDKIYIESFGGQQGRRADGMLCTSAGDLLRSVDAMEFHCRRMKAENAEFEKVLKRLSK